MTRLLTLITAALTCLACVTPIVGLAAGAQSGTDAATLVEGRAAGAAVAGIFVLDGPLASFHSTADEIEANAPIGQTSPSGSAPVASRIAPAHLGLSARLLHVETDVERYDVTTYATIPTQDVERHTYASVQGSSQPARKGFSFFLAPQPGHAPPTVHAEGIAATLSVDADGLVEHQPRWVPTARPTITSPDGPILAVGNDGLRSLRIEGDFVLMLWEWDLMLNSPSGSALVTSGFTGQSYLPALPEPIGDNAVGRDFEERQVFLYAQDAVLDVTLPVGAAAAITMVDAQGSLAGRVRLAGPDGVAATDSGSVALQDGDWLDGDLHVQASELSESDFRFAIGGEPEDARIGGRAATLGSIHGVASSSMWWVAGLAAVGLVAIAAAFVVRHRADRAHVAAVKTLMDAADYKGVVDRTTPRLLRLRRYGDAVRTQRAVAQLVLGRTNDAAQTLEGWSTGHEATRDYLWACVHAARGETAAAAKRLQSCMQRDPTLARQLLADPLMGQVGGARSSAPTAPAVTSAATDARTEGYV